MIKVENLSINDHSAAIVALFGSVEKYLNSPLLKELNDRIEYLEKVKSGILNGIEAEISRLPWWNLYGKLVGFVSVKMFVPGFTKEIDYLLDRYRGMRALPIKFFVNQTNLDFDSFYERNEKVITNAKIGKFTHDY